MLFPPEKMALTPGPSPNEKNGGGEEEALASGFSAIEKDGRGGMIVGGVV
jgi:hypothetical protein